MLMLSWKCKLSCLTVFGNCEFRWSWTSLDDLVPVVGIAVWLGIRRRSESRTCWIAETGWSTSQLLIRQLTGGLVDVSFDESTIVPAMSSARGQAVCLKSSLHLAGYNVIVLVMFPKKNLPSSSNEISCKFCVTKSMSKVMSKFSKCLSYETGIDMCKQLNLYIECFSNRHKIGNYVDSKINYLTLINNVLRGHIKPLCNKRKKEVSLLTYVCFNIEEEENDEKEENDLKLPIVTVKLHYGERKRVSVNSLVEIGSQR